MVDIQSAVAEIRRGKKERRKKKKKKKIETTGQKYNDLPYYIGPVSYTHLTLPTILRV